MKDIASTTKEIRNQSRKEKRKFKTAFPEEPEFRFKRCSNRFFSEYEIILIEQIQWGLHSRDRKALSYKGDLGMYKQMKFLLPKEIRAMLEWEINLYLHLEDFIWTEIDKESDDEIQDELNQMYDEETSSDVSGDESSSDYEDELNFVI
jgi:hypothetical protein